MGTSTASIYINVSMGKSFFSLSLKPFSVTQLELHVIGPCKVKETNQSMAMASEPMAMQPTIACQNGRGVWLYNPLPDTASQISSKEAAKRAAHSTARNAVLIPISQGTEVTIVTEYVPFRYFTHTVSIYIDISMGKSLFSLSLKLFSITQLELHVIGSCKVKETNQSMAVASEPMAMQPAIACQNGRGVWLYNPLPDTASQISSKEAAEHAAHSTARNAVLIPISQGTEVTIATEYVPFRYFTRTASIYIDVSMGTSSIMPCYDVERLETKTHVGLGPGESIEYIKHRVSLEGHPWPGCCPESDTWRPYSYGQTKQKRGLNNVVKLTRNIAI